MFKKLFFSSFLIFTSLINAGIPIREDMQEQSQLNPMLNIGCIFQVKFTNVSSLYAFQGAIEAHPNSPGRFQECGVNDGSTTVYMKFILTRPIRSLELVDLVESIVYGNQLQSCYLAFATLD